MAGRAPLGRRRGSRAVRGAAALTCLVVCSLAAPTPATAGPDLVVTDVAVNADCQIVVSLANRGSESLQASAYDAYLGASLSMRRSGQTFGGWRLAAIDAERRLRSPGGMLIWTRAEPRVEGQLDLEVTIDSGGVVAESNESNNVLSRRLSCSPPLPDLALLEVDFTEDCRPRVRAVNAGDGPAAERIYIASNGYVQRRIDGVPSGQIALGQLDSGHALASPGGSVVFVDGPEQRGARSISYELGGLGQEKSSANNAVQSDIPPRCAVASTAASADLAVSDLRVNEDCEIEVVLRNAGTTALPASAYDARLGPSLSLTKDGQPFGGYRLAAVDGTRALTAPGGTVTFERGSYKLDGSATIVATLGGGAGPDAEPGNDALERELRCVAALPDLALVAVTFTEECRTKLEVANLGSAALGDGSFRQGGAYVQRWIDGAPGGQIGLAELDPGRRLSPAAGSLEWIDAAAPRATRTARYELRRVGQEVGGGNNGQEVQVPARCQPDAARAPVRIPSQRSRRPSPARPADAP